MPFLKRSTAGTQCYTNAQNCKRLCPVEFLNKSSFISKRSDLPNYNTRQWVNLDLPQCEPATAQRSFQFRSVKIWNSLSAKTRKQSITSQF